MHTQNTSTSAVRTGSKFCDHCGKFGHTISQCWYKPKPQGQQQQNFPFQMEPKKIIQPQSQSVKSYKSQRLQKSRKINLQDVIDNEIIDLYSVIPNEGTVLTYMKIRFAPSFQRRVLIDTGACANVTSKRTFDEIKKEKTLFAPYKTAKSSLKQMRMAGGQLVSIETEVTIEFHMADMNFTETFLVLNSANSTIIGNPFFKKHHIHVCPKYNLPHFPDLTLQIIKIKPVNAPRRTNRVKKFPLVLTKKHIMAPRQTVIVECQLQDISTDMEKTTGIVVPSQELEEKCQLAITSSINEVNKQNIVYVTAFNMREHHLTLPFKTEIGKFSIFTLTQYKNLIQIEPQTLALAKMNQPDNVELGIIKNNFSKNEPIRSLRKKATA